MMKRPVVLDIDGSVGRLPDEYRLVLRNYEEDIRFGCTMSRFDKFSGVLDSLLPPADECGTVFMGSGDFHHLSLPLIERNIAANAFSSGRPVRVVVLDNHPDNMRFPWGVHCGSWVRRVAMRRDVSHVHVAGITSADIGGGHAWENYLLPLRNRKLTYWNVGVDTHWANRFGLSHAFRGFDSIEALTKALCESIAADPAPTYLSIDKDVFAKEVVQTNWDQGRMLESQAMAIIQSLAGHIVGSDVTGDVSAYRYHTWWKRWLSAQDGQDNEFDANELASWHADQHALNYRLAIAISRVLAPEPVRHSRY